MRVTKVSTPTRNTSHESEQGKESNGCRCGNGANRNKHVVSCNKIRCPCFSTVAGCSYLCSCNNCDNPRGKRISMPKSLVPMKRKRTQSLLKTGDCTGASFAARNEHLSIPKFGWNTTEYIILYQIAERAHQENAFSLRILCELFNIVIKGSGFKARGIKEVERVYCKLCCY